ncbi:MAG: S8 family peptidase [Gemmatimonadota bacterium]
MVTHPSALRRVIIGASAVLISVGMITACGDDAETLVSPSLSERPKGDAPLYTHSDSTRIEGEYFVVFKNTDGGSVRSKAADLTGPAADRIRKTYRRALNGFLIEADEETIARIRKSPLVEYVEENAVAHVVGIESSSVFAPTEQSTTEWHLDRIDQRTGYDSTYNWSEPSTNSRIYIVDTGIRRTHNEFTSRVATGWYDTSERSSTDDCHGHGTRVASLAAGTTYGTAKDAEIVPVSAENGDCNGLLDIGIVIDGLEWILDEDDPFSVVNLSIQKENGHNPLDTAVGNLIDDDYIVVVAAGNDDDGDCDDSPQRVDDAIVVAASTDQDDRWANSNYGTCIDIFAPGSSLTTAGISSDSDTDSGQDGTSLASPLVAGVIYAMQTEQHTALDNVEENFFGDFFTGTVGSATEDELSNIGAGSPNFLIYAPRSYLRNIGTKIVILATNYTWTARAYGGDEDEFTYLWETSTNGTSWTNVGTSDKYTRSFNAGDEFTLYMRLTVTNEFDDEMEHEIEIDVDVPCSGPLCPG